jgi:hypothetical protein
LDAQVRCLGIGHVSVAETHGNMGNVYNSLGDYEKALFHFNTALPILIWQLGNAHASVAMTKGSMANTSTRHLGTLIMQGSCSRKRTACS